MDFKSFDWRLLKRYVSPQATQDLNHFLENLPQHTGNSILVAAAVIWACAGGLGLYTFVQSRALAELRTELVNTESVVPKVPKVTNVAESPSQVKDFVESIKGFYKDLEIKANGSSVMISGNDTRFFPEFREAIGHVQNGGPAWRINIETICVGRECKGKPLAIELKVNTVSIE